MSLSLVRGGILVEKTPPPNSLPGQTLSTAALEKELSVPRRHHPARLSWLGRRCQESRILLQPPAASLAPSPRKPNCGCSPQPCSQVRQPRESQNSSGFVQPPLQHGALLPPPGDPPAQHPHPSTHIPRGPAMGRHPYRPPQSHHPRGKGKQSLRMPWEGASRMGGVDGKRCRVAGVC